MTIGTALYRLLIGPLELFFEVVFTLANRILNNPGLSIIFFSLAVNFLVLPMYRRVDELQLEEKERAERMKPMVDHIRRTFKGDERFMMLQTYYRQNNYKQTDALKGSVSLLLEIPFFIAAYHFLSNLQLLQGVSFGPIQNLGAPDGLIALGSLRVNLLPILMTGINAVSAAVYMKDFPLRTKLQTYGLALAFLVFLYGSPSGLVFYWTLNNLFSLIKNIFYKLKNPKLVLSAMASAVSLAGIVLLLFVHPMATLRRQLLALVLLAALQLPLLLTLLRRGRPARPEPALTGSEGKIFRAGAVMLAVLTGVLIPSAVIRSSPAEFVSVTSYQSPLWYVASSALLAAGTFLVWCGIFYRLAGPRGKRLMSLGAWVLAGVAAVDYMFFGTDYGTISARLMYDVYPTNPASAVLLNLLAAGAVAGLFWLLWKRWPGFTRLASLTLCLALAGMSALNVADISRQLQPIRRNIAAAQATPEIPLSRTGKNVMVFMMDRAVGFYVPYLLEEKPELKEQFAGFTFYPNTISFGSNTNVGAPALFGGYEYTPEKMNERSDELLADKHNEAMKMMPVLFDQAGYEVTVCDPSYAGYQWIPDLGIYNDYPSIHTYISEGKYDLDGVVDVADTDAEMHRNFFCYGLFRASPLLIQPTLYNRGLYNQADALIVRESGSNATTQTEDGVSRAKGLNRTFVNAYSVMQNLPGMTVIRDKGDTFMMISNNTAHEPCLLQEPAYEPLPSVDNTAYDAEHAVRTDGEGNSLRLGTLLQATHYQVNMAALIQLGNYMDYLRENDLYDNTRVIIVADHGWPLEQFNELMLKGQRRDDMLRFNPILMVKDFGAEDFDVDESFMTNADVPLLATAELIENPTNPFTGKALSDADKAAAEFHVAYTDYWDVNVNNGKTFLPNFWYGFSGGDVFDPAGWREIGLK